MLVKTMAMPCSSAAAMLSLNGKKASEAITEASTRPSSAALMPAILARERITFIS
jgi:hypothetical protein